MFNIKLQKVQLMSSNWLQKVQLIVSVVNFFKKCHMFFLCRYILTILYNFQSLYEKSEIKYSEICEALDF